MKPEEHRRSFVSRTIPCLLFSMYGIVFSLDLYATQKMCVKELHWGNVQNSRAFVARTKAMLLRLLSTNLLYLFSYLIAVSRFTVIWSHWLKLRKLDVNKHNFTYFVPFWRSTRRLEKMKLTEGSTLIALPFGKKGKMQCLKTTVHIF